MCFTCRHPGSTGQMHSWKQQPQVKLFHFMCAYVCVCMNVCVCLSVCMCFCACIHNYMFIQYVTGFGKACIVQTSNFSTLVTYKIYLEWQIHVKLSGILDTLFLYWSWKFQISTPFHVVFMGLQISKIRCVNYARFPNPVTLYWFGWVSCKW